MSSLKLSSIDNSIGIRVEIFREELGEKCRDSRAVFRGFEDTSASCRNYTNERVEGQDDWVIPRAGREYSKK